MTDVTTLLFQDIDMKLLCNLLFCGSIISEFSNLESVYQCRHMLGRYNLMKYDV